MAWETKGLGDQRFGPGILHSEDLQRGEASHFLMETDLLRTERDSRRNGVQGVS